MASPPDIEDVKAIILEISNNPLPGKISYCSLIVQKQCFIYLKLDKYWRYVQSYISSETQMM